MATPERNELHHGGNLAAMPGKSPGEIAGHIYHDPPFNMTRNYSMPFRQLKGSLGAVRNVAFKRTWTWVPWLCEEFNENTRNWRRVAPAR